MIKEQMYVFVRDNEILDELEGYEFVTANAKLLDIFTPITKIMDKGRSPSKAYKEYQEAVNKIIKENSEVDAKGNVIVNRLPDGRESYNIIDNKKVQKLIDELNKKHKDAIEAHDEKTTKFNDELEETIKVKYEMFKESELPKKILGKHMKIIRPLIDWTK